MASNRVAAPEAERISQRIIEKSILHLLKHEINEFDSIRSAAGSIFQLNELLMSLKAASEGASIQEAHRIQDRLESLEINSLDSITSKLLLLAKIKLVIIANDDRSKVDSLLRDQMNIHHFSNISIPIYLLSIQINCEGYKYCSKYDTINELITVAIESVQDSLPRNILKCWQGKYHYDFWALEDGLAILNSVDTDIIPVYYVGYRDLYLGACYLHKKKHQKAIKALKNSVLNFKKLDADCELAISNRYLGETYISIKQLDSAEIHINEVEHYYNKCYDPFAEILVLRMRARVAIVKKDFQSAEVLMNQILELSLNANDTFQIRDAYHFLTNIYMNLNESEKALECSEKMEEYHVYSKNLVSRSKLENQDQTGRTENTILNTKVNVVDSLLYSKEKLYKVLRISLLFTIIIALLILLRFYLYRLKTKKQADLINKKMIELNKEFSQKSQSLDVLSSNIIRSDRKEVSLELIENLKQSDDWVEFMNRAEMIYPNLFRVLLSEFEGLTLHDIVVSC